MQFLLEIVVPRKVVNLHGGLSSSMERITDQLNNGTPDYGETLRKLQKSALRETYYRRKLCRSFIGPQSNAQVYPKKDEA